MNVLTAIDRVHEYLATIGVNGKEPDSLITSDLQLVPKGPYLEKITRSFFAMISFGPFTSRFSNMKLSKVICTLEKEIKQAHSWDHSWPADTVIKANFIVNTLKNVKNKHDPHLNTLCLINQYLDCVQRKVPPKTKEHYLHYAQLIRNLYISGSNPTLHTLVEANLALLRDLYAKPIKVAHKSVHIKPRPSMIAEPLFDLPAGFYKKLLFHGDYLIVAGYPTTLWFNVKTKQFLPKQNDIVETIPLIHDGHLYTLTNPSDINDDTALQKWDLQNPSYPLETKILNSGVITHISSVAHGILLVSSDRQSVLVDFKKKRRILYEGLLPEQGVLCGSRFFFQNVDTAFRIAMLDVSRTDRAAEEFPFTERHTLLTATESLLVTTTADHAMYLFDLESKQKEGCFYGHSDRVLQVELTNELLFSRSASSIKIWNSKNRRCIRSIAITDAILHMVVSESTLFLLVSPDESKLGKVTTITYEQG